MKLTKHSTATLLLALLVPLLSLTAPPTARADDTEPALQALQHRLAELPAPFDSWNVQITAKAGEPGALDLSYDSPLLGRRTHNSVYLPTSYRTDGQPWPVLYFSGSPD